MNDHPASVAFQVDDEELHQVLAQWEWVKEGAGQGGRWNQAWGMSALAALQHMELSLAAHMDRLYNLVRNNCW